MTRTNKIAAVVAAVVMVLGIGATAVYATSANARDYIQPEPAVSQDAVIQTLEYIYAPQALTDITRGFTAEQIDWILYAMDNGKLPELSVEQIAEFQARVRDLLEPIYGSDLGMFFDVEMLDGLFAAFGDGNFDLSAILGADLQTILGAEDLQAMLETLGIQASLNEYLERGLNEGMIPPVLYDVIISAIETGEIDLTDEQIAELKVYAYGLLAWALEEEKIPQEFYDLAITAIETGEIELTDEQKAQLEAHVDEALAMILAEEKIPQEYRDMIAAAVETGEFNLTDEQKADLMAKADELLDKALEMALEEGIISQRLYNILASAKQTGSLELTIELIAEVHSGAVKILTLCLDEGKITQEQYDALVAVLEDIGRQIAVRGFMQR